MSALRAAVVGTGHLGQHHARIFSQTEGVRLAGVVDVDEARGREVAERCGCSWFPHYRELLPGVDLVSLAVPTRFHFSVARDLIEAGVPVLIEKPMTANLAEAEELVRLASARKVLVQVGHVERFNPAVVEIQKIAVRPCYIEADRISPFSFRSVDIGVVLDLMIHDIDILLHLTRSEVERVEAVGVSVLARSEDVANARLVFSSGCVANLTASRVSMKTERKIRIFQEDAYISMDYQARRALIYRKSEKMKRAGLNPEAVDPRSLPDPKAFVFGDLIEVEEVQMGSEEPLALEIAAFVQAVRDGTPSAVSAEDGLRAIRVAHRIQLAIAESAKRLHLS
ncbi:MAG: Gfo/Idh/MocA family oxidoreductase [Planctomycetes bacterium]|nr:Gfo/Idh/MocA family oxidoreductase [Planctomycetota bacterium]